MRLRRRRRRPLDDEAWLRGELEQRSLPVDAILGSARASARLVPASGRDGSTRLGGVPELPALAEWPEWQERPLACLGQVDLSEAASALRGELFGLPAAGRLACFYEGGEEAWGFAPADRGAGRVLYLAPGAATERRALPRDVPLQLRELRCALVRELTIAPWESIDFDDLGLDDTATDAYLEVESLIEQRAAAWYAAKHRFLGHPDPVQDAMQLSVQLAANGVDAGGAAGYEDPRSAELAPGARDWRLLLQVDTDEEGLGVMWGDAGTVYLWMREEDMREHAWSAVWPVFQCS